jgi:hypothetical protein
VSTARRTDPNQSGQTADVDRLASVFLCMNRLVLFEGGSCRLRVHARFVCCQPQPLILGQGQRSYIAVEMFNRCRLVANQQFEFCL